MIEYQTPHAEAAASRVMRVEDAVGGKCPVENGGFSHRGSIDVFDSIQRQSARAA